MVSTDKSNSFRRKIDGQNCLDGFGVLKSADGSTEYIGEFVKNKMEGRGRICHANGDIYQGDWKDNMANGRGCLVSGESGNGYEGEWLNDKQHG